MFDEYGVQIMTPAYEGDPEQAKVVPKDREWFEFGEPTGRELRGRNLHAMAPPLDNP